MPPDDLGSLADLVPAPVETVVVEDLSHILRLQPGEPTLRTYKRDARRPVDPRGCSTR